MKTRKIVEGAIITGLYAVFLAINLYTAGLFEYIIYFIMPLPFVVYGYRYGIKYNAMLFFSTTVISFIVSIPTTMIYMITANVVGITMAECLKRKIAIRNMYMITLLITGICNLLTYTIFAKLFDFDLIKEATKLFNFVQPILKYFNLDYLLTLEKATRIVLSLFILVVFIEAYIMLSVILLVIPRLKIALPGRFHLFYLRLPKWYGVISLVMIFGLPYIDVKQELLRSTLQYISLFSYICIVIQGCIIIGYYFTIKRKPYVFAIICLLAMIPFINYIHLFFGFVDILSDFRRKILYND